MLKTTKTTNGSVEVIEVRDGEKLVRRTTKDANRNEQKTVKEFYENGKLTSARIEKRYVPSTNNTSIMISEGLYNTYVVTTVGPRVNGKAVAPVKSNMSLSDVEKLLDKEAGRTSNKTAETVGVKPVTISKPVLHSVEMARRAGVDSSRIMTSTSDLDAWMR